jgi:hypothetical protein
VDYALRGDKEMRSESLPPAEPAGYLRDFLDDVAGASKQDALETKSLLAAQRFTLKIQETADKA